jgi:hypothetical protein
MDDNTLDQLSMRFYFKNWRYKDYLNCPCLLISPIPGMGITSRKAIYNKVTAIVNTRKHSLQRSMLKG